MNFNLLLINPWIYDFAAYNFWSRPLGLLKVAEFLSQFNVKITFIDCCDSFKVKKFGTGKYTSVEVEKPGIIQFIPRKYKRYGIPESEFIEKVRNLGKKVDLILVTSIMSYWWYGVKHVVDILRDFLPQTTIILGGIYATLYKNHAEENIGVDYVYSGEIEEAFINVLNKFGINIKKIYNKPKYWWQMRFYKKMPYAPILTSKGCPFRCAYCASSLLNKSFEQRNIEEVFEEIKELYRLGVREFAFYDDALLFRAEEHIKPLLRKIIREKLNAHFHTPNGLHARFIDEELAKLMKNSGFKTIRISLETVDIKRQMESGGKVTNEDVERAVFNLKKAGISSQEIGIYLMYGLPQQSLQEVKAGIEFIKKLKVRIHLTEFSPIKGTLYWHQLVNNGVINDDMDPLLTNNTIFARIFCQYDIEELENLKIDVQKYNLLL